MGILDIFRRRPDAQAAGVPARPLAMTGAGQTFGGLTDPRLAEFLRGGDGGLTESGVTVTPRQALKNTTVLRCVSLIAFSVGMLPLHLRRRDTKQVAREHALFRVLHRRPNSWQTAFEFRCLMQQRMLERGDAFALIVRSRGQVLQLIPLDPDRVRVEQQDDLSLLYRYARKEGGERRLGQEEVLHIREGLSEDGVHGISRVAKAAEAIGLALQAERATARLFRNGVIVGQALRHPGRLSPEAYARLRESLDERAGAAEAHRSMILEEGMDLASGGSTGRDAQAFEQRRQQVEEIARAFGVPRPLLVVDDTAWGSGIGVLGQFFIRYGLNPFFVAWEQAVERSLLSPAEADEYEAKFNTGGLIRGSQTEQAEFFARGLGAGGHQPWLHPDEVREMSDLPRRDDLPPPPGGAGTGDET